MSTVQERRDELSVIASDLDTIARRLAVLGHEAHVTPDANEVVTGREAYWIDHAIDDVILAQEKVGRLTA